MIHPFLILPSVGALMLIKILLSNASKAGYQSGTMGMILLVIITITAIAYFITTDMKPPIAYHHQPQADNDRMPLGPFNLRPLFNLGEVFFEQHVVDDADDADDAVLLIDVLENHAGALAMMPVNDNTDVHNSQIQSSLRQSLERLQNWYSKVPYPTSASCTYNEIKSYIFNDYKDTLDKKERAYNVVRHMEKHNGTLHSVKLSETRILQMIWQRINSPINQSVKDQLKENLIGLLSDSSIKLDQPYCLVGRITRMVQSLQMLDTEGLVSIKNLQTIHTELQTKIPLLCKQYFKAHPDQEKSYEEGDEEVGIALLQFVKEKLQSDYPNSSEDTKLQKAIDSHVEQLV